MRFNYQARNLVGQKVDGVMLADDEGQLAWTLRRMDLYLIAAKPEKISTPIYITRPVKRKELINFTLHLSTSVGAGITILQSLEDMEEQTSNPAMKRAIQAIMEDLRGGSRLSDALSHHPLIFSDVYVSMVKSGEASGKLDHVLERIVAFLEWQDALASEIKRASIYPTVVLVALIALLAVLLGFVFPKILPVIQHLNVPLPLITRAVMAAVDIVRYDWYWRGFG